PSKTAILTVEFARAQRRRGEATVTAATPAAGPRFRAVMMPSFAFILGLVPLVIAAGAGAATQRAVGTAVFGGMIAASCLGIFVIPGLYVAFQTFREKVKGMGKTKAPVVPSHARDSCGYSGRSAPEPMRSRNTASCRVVSCPGGALRTASSSVSVWRHSSAGRERPS